MEFDFTEEQEMLRNTARDFLVKECSGTFIRDMEKDKRGYTTELWSKMVDLGWMGLAVPEEYGGNGGNFLDLCVLIEEMGRACLPGPFFSTMVLGGLTILAAGNEQQKKEFLPKIANGKLIVTAALTDAGGRCEPSPSAVVTGAVTEDASYVIDGTKLFVTDAHVADYILCVTRTKDDEGITVFVVDAKTPGVKCTLLKTLAGDKQCEVIFDNVKVPKENILGKVDMGWPIAEEMLERAVAAKCIEMVGGARITVEMSVDYAKHRVQFDHPIGSFQAIQHHCANMLTDLDGSWFAAYHAAWKISQGLPATMEVSIAKAWIGEAYRRITLLGHQIFGGISFCEDNDINLYSRRANTGALIFGDTACYYEKVARQLLEGGEL